MSKWTEGAEGFICPYCLVSFASSNKLQAHFIDFHSNEGGDAAIILEPETTSDESVVFEDELGHSWKPVTLPKPEKCEVCKEIIWSSSLTCQECEMVIHFEKCQDQVTRVCNDTKKSNGPSNLEQSSRERQDSGGSSGPPPIKGIQAIVKRQVAKGRQRYVDEKFDLDLSYITDRVIAMSYPATGVESAYRNNLKDVANMLKSRHDENYMVFNLSERSYDISRFNNQVLDFGWPDHLAPSLERLGIVCKSMKSWLDSDPQHVVVVHCKGGKGRTGCVIAAFMHYSKICQSADDALDHFAMKRFYDDKLQGVTQPSQRRYVHYFEDMLNGKVVLDAPPIKLTHVIIHGIPDFDGKGGCRPFLKVYQNMQLVHTSGLYVCNSETERVKISLYGGLKLDGEVLMKCFHKKSHGGVDSIFRCQFHHAIVQEHRLVFSKTELDDSFKDKRFAEQIKVEFIFEKCGSVTLRKKKVAKLEPDLKDIRHSLLADRSSMEHSYDEKRNSYSSFEGGYDHGKPEGEVPDLINFDSITKDRCVSIPVDPDSIERVETKDGDIYTVVSKVNSSDEDPSPVPNKKKPSKFELEGDKSQKYSHLVHNRNSSCLPEQQQPDKKKKPAVKPKRPPLPTPGTTYDQLHTKLDRKPYDDVVEDKKLVLTPVMRRQSDKENDMWMAVKWQTLSQQPDRSESISSSQRSSSQSALDQLGMADTYTNVADIATGKVFVHQRRHSFTEGDSSIIITSPSANQTLERSNDDEIYSVPPDADTNGRDGDYSDIEEDYVNTGAENMDPPTYENRDEVRQKVIDMQPAKVITNKLPPSNVKDMILESLRFKKPETVTIIQSSALLQSEKKQTLGMFNFTDPKTNKLQVGRGDYEQFSLDAWSQGPSGDRHGHHSPTQSNYINHVPSSSRGNPRPPPPTRDPPSRPPPNVPAPVKSPKPPVPRPNTPTIHEEPVRRQSPLPPSTVSASALETESRDKSNAFVRPHLPLAQVRSQPQLPPNPSSGQQSSRLSHHHKPMAPPTHASVRNKPNPPPKPAPYQPPPSTCATVQDVKDLRSFWYKPSITRDEAISLVKRMSPGSFIVRDSQTVSGGYALTIKVDKDLVRQRKKLEDSIEITEDMCVNHFLIQPDPEGVKLQGWAESSFKSLPEFIAKHTAEKMCLPCVLKLPNRDSRPPVKRRAENVTQALKSGAACDVILLGTIDVSGTVGDQVIAEAVEQLQALDLPIMTVVNFKASSTGITVTESTNGKLTKRNYPLQSITYCGMDPNDTRWDAPLLGDNVINKPCFGFVHQLQGSPGHSCLVFAELEPKSPISNVVAYIKKLLKSS